MNDNIVHYLVALSTVLNYAVSKQVDLVLGLDVSVNDDNFAIQKQFFQNLTRDLYSSDTSLSIRVGVFGFVDTIRMNSQNVLWPLQNMTESEAIKAIETLENTNTSQEAYLDHALRFALASFDDDRSKNKERECGEKLLILMVTDYEDKWSDGGTELKRLQTMGVKTLFIVIETENTKTKLMDLEETLLLSSFSKLFSSESLGNGTDFLQNTLDKGLGSCCGGALEGSYFMQPTCSNYMGSRCKIKCNQFLVMQPVVLATCEPNGIWSLGSEKACSDFEFHLLSFLIGTGSSVLLLITVLVIVVLLCKRKCCGKKMPVTPALQSSYRSERNQYSPSESQKMVTEDVVPSDDHSENTENDAMVYDYAEETLMSNLSKRAITYKRSLQNKSFRNDSKTTKYTRGASNNKDQGHLLPALNMNSNVPTACLGMSGLGYTECDDDIYINEDMNSEDDQQVYVNI